MHTCTFVAVRALVTVTCSVRWLCKPQPRTPCHQAGHQVENCDSRLSCNFVPSEKPECQTQKKKKKKKEQHPLSHFPVSYTSCQPHLYGRARVSVCVGVCACVCMGGGGVSVYTWTCSSVGCHGVMQVGNIRNFLHRLLIMPRAWSYTALCRVKRSIYYLSKRLVTNSITSGWNRHRRRIDTGMDGRRARGKISLVLVFVAEMVFRCLSRWEA